MELTLDKVLYKKRRLDIYNGKFSCWFVVRPQASKFDTRAFGNHVYDEDVSELQRATRGLDDVLIETTPQTKTDIHGNLLYRHSIRFYNDDTKKQKKSEIAITQVLTRLGYTED